MNPQATEPRKKKGSMLKLAVGLIIAGVFAYLAFGRIEWAEAWQAMRNAKLLPLLLAIPLVLCDFSLRAMRWWWMLRRFDPNVPAKACFAPFFGAVAANNVLPMRAGDLIRIVGFRHHVGAPAMRILGTMIIERLLDLFVLLGVFFVGLQALPEGTISPKFTTGASIVAGVALGILIMLLIAERPILALVRRLEHSGFAEHRPVIMRALKWAEQVLTTTGLFRSPMMVLTLLGFTISAWMLEGAVFACVAWSLSLDVQIAGAWFAMSCATLATLIPSSPGYVGTFDYFAMAGIIAYGAEREPAAVFALITHVIIWLTMTCLGGLLLLAPRGRRVLHDAQQLDPDTLSAESS